MQWVAPSPAEGRAPDGASLNVLPLLVLQLNRIDQEHCLSSAEASSQDAVVLHCPVIQCRRVVPCFSCGGLKKPELTLCGGVLACCG